MNIVKFKNIKLDSTSGLTDEQIELFNESFSGKYSHAINWKWCIPLDAIDIEDVARISRELSINSTEVIAPLTVENNTIYKWKLVEDDIWGLMGIPDPTPYYEANSEYPTWTPDIEAKAERFADRTFVMVSPDIWRRDNTPDNVSYTYNIGDRFVAVQPIKEYGKNYAFEAVPGTFSTPVGGSTVGTMMDDFAENYAKLCEFHFELNSTKWNLTSPPWLFNIYNIDPNNTKRYLAGDVSWPTLSASTVPFYNLSPDDIQEGFDSINEDVEMYRDFLSWNVSMDPTTKIFKIHTPYNWDVTEDEEGIGIMTYSNALLCFNLPSNGSVRLKTYNETTYTQNTCGVYLYEKVKVTDHLLNIDNLPCDKLMSYIDIEATEKINDVAKLLNMNNNPVDEDGIPLELLKKFRSWLAQFILGTEEIEDEDIIHMLKYYAGGMYDDVVKALNTFGNDSISLITATGMSSCGCVNGANLTNALGTLGSICDPLAIYRKNIYNYMVNEFSSIKFWEQFDTDFLTIFKAYIDGIIEVGLPLNVVDWQTDFVDCSCSINANTSQDINVQRLKKLSVALGYMIADEIKGHKNYIGDALTDWATYLYERMEW